MIEAQERHEKSPKKMTSTHARCDSLYVVFIFIVLYVLKGFRYFKEIYDYQGWVLVVNDNTIIQYQL